MRHSLNQFSSILDPKPQINLYVVNTFFALTVASYYVAAHHAPKGLHWPSHLKLYEVQKDILEEKPLLDELSLLLLLRNPPHFSIHQPLDRSISKQGIFSVSQPTLVLGDLLDNGVIIGGNLGKSYRVQDTINENVHVSLFRRESLHFQPNPAVIENLNPMKITAQGDMEKLMVKLSPLSPSSELPPLAASTIDNFKTVYQGTLSVDDPLNLMLGHKISIIKNGSIREIMENKTVVNVEPFPPKPQTVKTEPSPESHPVGVPVWSKLMLKVQSKSYLLQFWLMKLLPGGSRVKPHEIPFQEALADTLIDFQHHIGPNWEPPVGPGWEPFEEGDEDGNNSEEGKELRRKFHDAYMKRIDWTRTGFKGLSRNEKLEDLPHHIYMKAHDFPLKLGIRVYCDDDICKWE